MKTKEKKPKKPRKHTKLGNAIIKLFKKIRWNSLKNKVLLIILLIVVTSNTALVMTAYKKSKQEINNSVETILTTISQNCANVIYEENERLFHLLEGLASVGLIKDPTLSIQEKDEELAYSISLDPDYITIAYYDKNGMGYNANKELVSYAEEDWFKQAIKGNRAIKDPYYVEDLDMLYMYYAVPVKDYDGNIIGVISSIVNGEKLCNVCANITYCSSSHPFVINMDVGNTIADAKPKYVKKGQNLSTTKNENMRKAILDAMTGAVRYSTFYESSRKTDMIACYRPVGDNCRWAVFCMGPMNEYLGGVKQLLNNMILLLILSILVSVFVCYALVSGLIRPLFTVKKSVRDIATGSADLTKRITVKSKDEIGDLVTDFNGFTEKLQSIISQVKSSKEGLGNSGEDLLQGIENTSEALSTIIENINTVHSQLDEQTNSVNQTSNAVNNVSVSIDSLEKLIDVQSAEVSEASSAVEQMIGNINSVNQSVDMMASSFSMLRTNAENGVLKQNVVNERIAQIEEQSKTLQEANKTIANIASQTNLLAMNAAIEAAHAGRAGQGFSVVADEIRKLSETSTAQSKTIKNQLKSIQKSIGGVVQASEESSTAFKVVNDMINKTDGIVSTIKIAMTEQTQGSAQINQALHSMNSSTVEVKKASEQMTEGNKAIISEMEVLQSSTNEMASSMGVMFESTKRVSESGMALKDISGTMQNHINDIGNQIDLFTV